MSLTLIRSSTLGQQWEIMYFKTLLNEITDKGEKILSDVTEELMKSKTIHRFVKSKDFALAVGKLIEMKDDIKRVAGNQISAIFDLMDLPTKNEIKRIAGKVGSLEKIFDQFMGPNGKRSRCPSKKKRQVVVKKGWRKR